MRKPLRSPATCLLGAHFSIAGGVHNALLEAAAYGCNALQIFTKNTNSWKERIFSTAEIERFDAERRKSGVESIAAHTSYLINLASPDRQKHAMSCHALTQELIRSSQLKIPYAVLHPGAHMGRGTPAGIRQVAESVEAVFAENPDITTRLLFETTAGQGSSIGHTFEQLATIMENVRQRDRIGICLDTCHIFAAGYDIRDEAAYHRTVAQFDTVIGLDRLFMIHLNDSRKGLAGSVDRHEHIGDGAIGIRAFSLFMNDPRFAAIPKIIETPKNKKDKNADRINLDRLKALLNASGL